jgi:hypothetical protein
MVCGRCPSSDIPEEQIVFETRSLSFLMWKGGQGPSLCVCVCVCVTYFKESYFPDSGNLSLRKLLSWAPAYKGIKGIL